MNKYFKSKLVRSYYAITKQGYFIVKILSIGIGVEVYESSIFSDDYIKDNFSKCTKAEFEAAKKEAISKL